VVWLIPGEELDVDVPDLLDRDLAFLDCEMTGVDPERNEIIEIGCARTSLPTLSAPAELGVRVIPRTMRGSDRVSIRIASYSPQKWKDAVPLEKALADLRTLADGCLLVGWATHHDLAFLNTAANRLGMEPFFPEGYVELQDWAQRRFGLSKTPGLQRIADQLKIVRDEEHSALEDALVTYEVFRMLWRYDAEELRRAIPTLDWNSYAELSGPISLAPEAIEARRRELAAHLMTDVRLDVLVARARR
jgi:DNA polymerase III alpha subunit (gram-positive type)